VTESAPREDAAADRTLLSAIIENMPSGVMITDASTGTVTLVNDQVERLIGFAVDVGEPANSSRIAMFRLDGAEYDVDDRPLARALRGERTLGEIVEIVLADGSRKFLDVSAAPIRDASGEVVAAVLTLQDVSERYQQERAEREFVTNAAHELRTPLASITSAIEVLQAGAKERPEERDLFLGHIETAVGRLGRLTHALLVLARAQTRVEDPTSELVPVERLLRDAAAALAPDEGVELVVEAPANLAVVANRVLLEQAVGAIAANAVRYTRTGRIEIAAARDDGAVTITVTDTGVGFPAELSERVLDRFSRASASEIEGFGLGLAIARQSVETVGGKLALRSEPGVGTTARITIPGAARVST
jgi:PAS domain S-box-containing protein